MAVALSRACPPLREPSGDLRAAFAGNGGAGDPDAPIALIRAPACAWGAVENSKCPLWLPTICERLSTAIGKMLAAKCTDSVKRVTLELGGNAPFVVFDDADLGREGSRHGVEDYLDLKMICSEIAVTSRDGVRT